MILLFRLALRNLFRNSRRTLLTLGAMIASSSLLILALGVFSGMFVDMLASATDQYSGHLVVAAKGYLDDRDMHAHFAADAVAGQPWLQAVGVTGASPRLRSFGLLSLADRTQPVELLGVQPAREVLVTRLQNKLTEGEYLNPGQGRSVVIGAGLAGKLHAGLGDELVFVTQAADGSIGNDLVLVAGIFRTGDAGNDNGLVLANLEWLQELLVLPGRIHEVALAVEEPLQAPSYARSMKPLLAPDLEIRDWGQLLPEMAEIVASYGASTLILSLILYSAAGLGIINTQFMSVMERTHEFGLLLAMGVKPGQVRLLVLLETMLLGITAVLIGAGLGFVLTLTMKVVGIDLSGLLSPISYAGGTILPRLHAEFDLRNFWLPSVTLFAIALAAGWLPARQASRLLPVQALRRS